jgi:hypothetical protein
MGIIAATLEVQLEAGSELDTGHHISASLQFGKFLFFLFQFFKIVRSGSSLRSQSPTESNFYIMKGKANFDSHCMLNVGASEGMN